MESAVPHYLRFVRTLALATTIALPACSDGSVAADDDGAPTGATTSSPAPQTAPAPVPVPAPTAAATTTTTETAPPSTDTSTATAENDAGAEGDASYHFSSGPLPPLEMPASLV